MLILFYFLKTEKDFNSIVLVATYPDDVTRDVTFESKAWVEDSSIVEFKDRILIPKRWRYQTHCSISEPKA